MNTLDISSYPPNLLSDIEIIYGKALLQLILSLKNQQRESYLSVKT